MKSLKAILNQAAGKATKLVKKEQQELGKLKDAAIEELSHKKTAKEIATDAAIVIGITLVTGGGPLVPIFTGALTEVVVSSIARKISTANKNKKANKPKDGPAS